MVWFQASRLFKKKLNRWKWLVIIWALHNTFCLRVCLHFFLVERLLNIQPVEKYNEHCFLVCKMHWGIFLNSKGFSIVLKMADSMISVLSSKLGSWLWHTVCLAKAPYVSESHNSWSHTGIRYDRMEALLVGTK